MRLEGGLVIVDLVKEDAVLAIVRPADVEPLAAGLVASRSLGVVRHQAQEGIELHGNDIELDGDEIALHVFFPLSRSRSGAPMSSARMPGRTGMKRSPWPRILASR